MPDVSQKLFPQPLPSLVKWRKEPSILRMKRTKSRLCTKFNFPLPIPQPPVFLHFQVCCAWSIPSINQQNPMKAATEEDSPHSRERGTELDRDRIPLRPWEFRRTSFSLMGCWERERERAREPVKISLSLILRTHTHTRRKNGSSIIGTRPRKPNSEFRQRKREPIENMRAATIGLEHK